MVVNSALSDIVKLLIIIIIIFTRKLEVIFIFLIKLIFIAYG